MDRPPPNYCSQANGANLVLWETGPDSGGGNNLTFSDQNSSVNGVIWVQGGNLSYTSNSGAFGFYEAQNISVSGNHYIMNGTGPAIGGAPVTTTITTGISTVSNTIPTTVYSTSTGTNITPDSTSAFDNTTTSVTPGTTVNPTTETVTNGVSTNLKLKK